MSRQQEAGRIFGVRIDQVTVAEIIDRAVRVISERRRETFMYANVHVLNTAYTDRRLAGIINKADIVYADGAGAVLGGRLLGFDLGERLTGADWIYPICQTLADKKLRPFIVAGAEGVAAEAAVVLEKSFPGLKFAGVHHGYFDKQNCDDVVKIINDSDPDLVFIGLGTPLQEFWCDEVRDSISAPLVWPVGALFEFVAGRIRRGPRWMLDHGLEWLARLIAEPTKLGRRYIIGNPLFILRIFREKIFGSKFK